MKRFGPTALIGLLLLTACASIPVHKLIAPREYTDDIRVRDGWECLATALRAAELGRPPLDDAAKALLGGRDTRGFLWWGSMAGPRPVADRQGVFTSLSTVHSPPLSILPGSSSPRDVSDRYVLCLLMRGYQWRNGGGP